MKMNPIKTERIGVMPDLREEAEAQAAIQRVRNVIWGPFIYQPTIRQRLASVIHWIGVCLFWMVALIFVLGWIFALIMWSRGAFGGS